MYRVVSLLALVVLLPLAPAAETPKESLRDYALKGVGRTAYGIYIGLKKAGWEVDEVKLGKHDGKEAAILTTLAYMAVDVDGTKSVQEEKTADYYELEGDGAIFFSESHVTEDGQETVRTAVRNGDGLTQTIQVGKHTTTRKLPLPKSTLAMQRDLERWLQGPPKKGATFDNYTLAWDQDKVDVKEVYTFKEKKTVQWEGVATEAYIVQTLSQGAKFDATLLGDGRPLIGKIGVLEMRMEKEPLAKKLDQNVDLMAATSIRVDKSLGRVSNIEKLTLAVTGLDDFVLPESPRQRMLHKDGMTMLELSREPRADKPAPLGYENRLENLRATASMQSDHETLRKLAKEIVGDEKEPLKAATRIEKWVYKTLRKTYDANADDALTVLENKAGDCTEHTLLFTALARAAGIPAHEVGGLVYAGGDKPSFGWHAWAEIHDGSQWVTVDPTFGQVNVDPTHIKFSEGSEDQAYLNVAGKLKMKVVKVELKK